MHEPVFDRADLAFHATGHVQPGAAPVLEREIRIGQLGGDGNNEKIAGIRSKPDDNGTLERLRSEKGTGSSTASWREQLSVNVIRLVVPQFPQATLALRQPFVSLAPVAQRRDRHAHAGVFAQWQRLREAETTVFINGFNDSDHANDGATHPRLLQGGTARNRFEKWEDYRERNGVRPA